MGVRDWINAARNWANGDATVENSGGFRTAEGRAPNGERVWISQGKGQTIVRTGDVQFIVNGNGADGLATHTRYASHGEQHATERGANELLQQVVQNAMRDGKITPQEFSQIERTAENGADQHIQNHSGGRTQSSGGREH